jgi:putative ABC transport system permease protein
MLAEILGVKVGDSVEVDFLDEQRRTVTLPIAVLVEDYFGIRGMMDLTALARLMREAPTVSGVHFTFDANERDQLYESIKGLPTVSGLSLQPASLANFRESLALLVTTMAGIYTTLAAVIAFGVGYNSARISLSERARELASLRVLGFTRAEVIRILLLELALLTVLAQPLGWGVGYALSWFMRSSLAGELMRVRLVLENATYLLASAVVVMAALASAIVVVRRIRRLDLVAVLKTRE